MHRLLALLTAAFFSSFALGCMQPEVALEETYAQGNDGPLGAQHLGELTEHEDGSVGVVGSFTRGGLPDLSDEDWYTVDLKDIVNTRLDDWSTNGFHLGIEVAPGASPDHLESQDACAEFKRTELSLYFACPSSDLSEYEQGVVQEVHFVERHPDLTARDGSLLEGAQWSVSGTNFTDISLACDDRADDSGRVFLRLYSDPNWPVRFEQSYQNFTRYEEYLEFFSEHREDCSEYEVRLSLVEP